MYTKLAQDILKTLPVTEAELRKEARLPADEELRDRLTKVKTLDDLLDALRSLEFVVAARNALTLSKYAWTEPLIKQEDRSADVRQQAMVLYKAYRSVAAKVAPVLAGGLPGVPAESAELLKAKADFATVAGRITVDTGENQPGTADYLGVIHQMVLLCLAVTTRGADGRRLLAGLAASPKAAIIIDLRHKLNPSSLLAYGPDGSDSQYAKPAAPLTGDIPASTRGAGSRSYLGAPVWLDGEIDSTEAGSQLFKKYLSVDRAHERILLGSLSFGEGKFAFFSPLRIELMHELLHVLHNAQGTNRAAVKLTGGLTTALWTNGEEYATIAGGDLTENALGAEIGLPDRYGHSGLSLDFLSAKSEAAVDSLAKLSRIP
ncbi:hypothetical protein [Actinoplanes sp. NPDC051859]|uniref:hypothetical protein n=1 Tax=Actinoplanes sp. NPDC051859 TaxID=3363909 RepID=UPI0037A306E6